MTNKGKPLLSQRVRELRAARGLTLSQAAALTGLAASSLSKVENGEMSLTYDKLLQLAEGLGINVSELFAPEESRSEQLPLTRRSVNIIGSEYKVETPNYEYHFLSTDLMKKQMIPVVGIMKARTLEEFGPLVRHSGEEFLYVLEGTVEVHTEHYRPVRLKVGESIYIDSGMGHAYLAVGDAPAKLLAICTCPDQHDLEVVIAATIPSEAAA